jgi:cation:H+ antiporter
MFFWIVFLIIGFVLLLKGADWLVGGSVKIAHRFKVSPLLIGLTIVAFGTSFPELVVNIIAAFKNTADIALGNIVGSNIANIGLILGLAVILRPIKVKVSTLAIEVPLLLLASLVFLILVSDTVFQKFTSNFLSRGDGLILLLLFGVFLYYITHSLITRRKAPKEFISLEKKIIAHQPLTKNIFLILLGVTALYLGGQTVIESGLKLATTLGLSQGFIGLVFIALGTSLPELATSLWAAFKKEKDVALGNIVGSNIFNTLFVLGLTSVINPLYFTQGLLGDILIMLVFTLLLFIFSFSHKLKLVRWEGGVLFAFYFLYLIFLFIRH